MNIDLCFLILGLNCGKINKYAYTMEKFLEDLEHYNQSMENAYLIVTKKKTLDDIYLELENDDYEEFYLPFDPILHDGRDSATIDLLICHFEELEEYEKCAELKILQTKCLEIQTESDQQL
tara:strand:+ start:136 stop:498 length:363 start_codon:yes stop_codon:yes gene_type:complete